MSELSILGSETERLTFSWIKRDYFLVSWNQLNHSLRSFKNSPLTRPTSTDNKWLAKPNFRGQLTLLVALCPVEVSSLLIGL
jgi:hypothetical protein